MRSRLQPKWLEILSIGTTLGVTIPGWFAVAAYAHWVETTTRDWGMAGPAPAEFVIDLVNAPFSSGALIIVVPIVLAFLGASANGNGKRALGPALLLLAPQLAMLQVFLAVAALSLPFFSVARAPRPRAEAADGTPVNGCVHGWLPLHGYGKTSRSFRATTEQTSPFMLER